MFVVHFSDFKHFAISDHIAGDEIPTEHDICSNQKINLLFINKTHRIIYVGEVEVDAPCPYHRFARTYFTN